MVLFHGEEKNIFQNEDLGEEMEVSEEMFIYKQLQI
jgi:hypothetical protein